MRAGRTLRRIIMDRLIEQVPDVAGRIYDRAIEATQYPYITLGPSYWTDASAECIQARSQTVQIDIWHDSNKGATEDLVDDVTTALDGWADQGALTMHPLRITLVRVMDDPDPGIVHGAVQIEAEVEG